FVGRNVVCSRRAHGGLVARVAFRWRATSHTRNGGGEPPAACQLEVPTAGLRLRKPPFRAVNRAGIEAAATDVNPPTNSGRWSAARRARCARGYLSRVDPGGRHGR